MLKPRQQRWAVFGVCAEAASAEMHCFAQGVCCAKPRVPAAYDMDLRCFAICAVLPTEKGKYVHQGVCCAKPRVSAEKGKYVRCAKGVCCAEPCVYVTLGIFEAYDGC